MHILEVVIENTKKIKCFKLQLDGKNMEVAGQTGVGKTTAISALWDIMEKKADQLTHGAKKGQIQITLGDSERTIIAKRVNKKGGLSTIKLSDAKGKAVSIKDFKDMVSELSINPHKIVDMKPKERVATLLKAANLGDTSLDEIDAEIADYEESRLQWHRNAEAVKPGPEPEKAERVEALELRNKIQEAEEKNKVVDQKVEKLNGLKQSLSKVQAEIQEMQEELRLLEKEEEELEVRVVKGTRICNSLEKQNTSKMWGEFTELDATNKKAAEYEAWQKRNKEHEEALEQKRIFDEQVKELRDQKKDALDNAKWPIEGLSIEEGDILYNGVLLTNLGESEQMLVCAALAMEDIKNHPIKVVRMDGVESLSAKDFKQVQEMFNSAGVQVLSTRVARGDVEDNEIEITEGVYGEG